MSVIYFIKYIFIYDPTTVEKKGKLKKLQLICASLKKGNKKFNKYIIVQKYFQ